MVFQNGNLKQNNNVKNKCISGKPTKSLKSFESSKKNKPSDVSAGLNNEQVQVYQMAATGAPAALSKPLYIVPIRQLLSQ